MKKILQIISIIILISIFSTATYSEDNLNSNYSNLSTTSSEINITPTPKPIKYFLQVGALERKDGDKYLLKKRNGKIEFYINNETKIFLKEEKQEELKEGNFLVIKGPKNKKAIIANSVYVYENKEEYKEYISIKKISKKDKKITYYLKGNVKNSGNMFDNISEDFKPILLEVCDDEEETSDNKCRDYFVFTDDTTYWVFVRKVDNSEIKVGDRLKLYFDKLISIRYKNYPKKIVIDRIKSFF